MEQTSTTISLLVERVVKAFPHDAQRTVVRVSPGWTCFKEIPPSCLRRRRTSRYQPHGSAPASNKTLTGPCSFPQPSTPIAEIALSKRTLRPGCRSGEESIDEEPDPHPSSDCEWSEDDQESSQLATGLGRGPARGLLFARPGKRIAGSGFRLDKRSSEDQERLDILIVRVDQDAGAHLSRSAPSLMSIRGLPASLPRNGQRVRATSQVPPNPLLGQGRGRGGFRCRHLDNDGRRHDDRLRLGDDVRHYLGHRLDLRDDLGLRRLANLRDPRAGYRHRQGLRATRPRYGAKGPDGTRFVFPCFVFVTTKVVVPPGPVTVSVRSVRLARSIWPPRSSPGATA